MGESTDNPDPTAVDIRIRHRPRYVGTGWYSYAFQAAIDLRAAIHDCNLRALGDRPPPCQTTNSRTPLNLVKDCLALSG